MVLLEALLFHGSIQGLLRFLTQLAVGVAALVGAPTAPPEPGAAATLEAGFQEASAALPPAPFVFTPAEGMPGLRIPRQERLVYRTYLDLSIVSTYVGIVTQTCTVAEQSVPLVLTKPGASGGEAASIKLEADGSYLWYELESVLETRIQPEQQWPRLYYQQRTKSSRGLRRREVSVGWRDGVPIAEYRGDTSKGAPPGERIMREAEPRSVPEGTLDMLTAVLMARALIAGDSERLTFPLIDKNRLWQLTLRRGAERRVETGAGTFDAVQVVLEPSPYPGEDMAEKAKQFEGVFGIHGSIHLWVDKKTGIAVRIQGDLPIDDGLITLGIDVLLDSYSGTPPEFAPVAVPKR